MADPQVTLVAATHSAPSLSVVIATRHRSGPLRECLASLGHQTRLPKEVIVVDSSTDDDTSVACGEVAAYVQFPVMYVHTTTVSSARQRNAGAELATGDIIGFLDDDAIVDPGYIAALCAAFAGDVDGSVGGVVGTITNELAAPVSRRTEAALRFITGSDPYSSPGALTGPAVQYNYGLPTTPTTPVQWLTTCACAYRRHIFFAHRFVEHFNGYSFMEDVELSARVGKHYRLLQVRDATVVHKGLGGRTRRDWFAFAHSAVCNRHYVMAAVLGKRRLRDYVRLFMYELVYVPATDCKAACFPRDVPKLLLLYAGRLWGAVTVVVGRGWPVRRIARVAESDGARG
jgi:GT2 family glycosyltransferase